MYLDDGTKITSVCSNIYKTLEEATYIINSNRAKKIIQNYPACKKRCTEMEEFMNKYPEFFI
jgi:hypothetical protein